MMKTTNWFRIWAVLLFTAITGFAVFEYDRSILGQGRDLRPVACSQKFNLLLSTSQSIRLKGTTREGMPLTYTLLTRPAHGTLSGTIPNFVYTPAPGYTGSDCFKFRVHDKAGDSARAIVSLNVLPADHGPYAYPIPFATAACDSATVEQRLASVVVPQSWLDTATDWDVFQTAVSNPYFRTMTMSDDMDNAYEASLGSLDEPILGQVDAMPDFGECAVRWLDGIDLSTVLSVRCSETNAPCWIDYQIVWYMAGRDSAISTMDQAVMQKLFRMAVWDADYWNSVAGGSLALTPISTMYAIYNKPESVRGVFPAGVTLPVLLTNDTFAMEHGLVPTNVISAVSTAKSALGLVSRP